MFDLLNSEHRKIERMLDAAERALAPMNPARLRQALDFFDVFVHRMHHAMEEEVLFEEIVQREAMAHGPVEHLRKEHNLGRAYLSAAIEALDAAAGGDAEAMKRLEHGVRSYCETVRKHIQREEHFFSMATRVLSPSVQADIGERSAALKKERLRDGEYEMYLQIADDPDGEHTIVFRPKTSDTEITSVTPAQLVGLDARSLAAEETTTEGQDEETLMTGKAAGAFFDDGIHQNVLLYDFGRGLAVQANQFLIIHDGHGMILDPGGPKVYPNVLAETQLRLGKGKLDYVFLSHQDPDIGTSLNAWLMDTKATALVSKLWTRFLPHFGIDKLLARHLQPIPDAGMIIQLNGADLMLLPAHFLHSCGNFQVYDPRSKVLFTGDLGASLGMEYSTVRDFDDHIQYMAGFHRRYMVSQRALVVWAAMVKQLDIEVIAPQHGAMLNGKTMVRRFIDWCEVTPCGIDLMTEPYPLPTH